MSEGDIELCKSLEQKLCALGQPPALAAGHGFTAAHIAS